MNTYGVAMKDELVAALDELDGDPGVRAVVVTGAGVGLLRGGGPVRSRPVRRGRRRRAPAGQRR
jgi:enoyl-CoA hydratase/carnithine racemase